MDHNEKLNIVTEAFNALLRAGKVTSKTDFAAVVGISRQALSAAMNGNEQYLTDKLVARVVDVMNTKDATANITGTARTVPLVPFAARGGSLQDYADGTTEPECERITSPIRDATLAIEITGDSMAPDYPSGSRVLLKKVDSDLFVEWGETYLLDTDNGAVLKRVMATPEPGVIECRSINPEYAPFRIPTDRIRGWYRVLLVMALK